MLTVKKSSVFPTEKNEIFNRLQQIKTLQHIAYPFAVFTPVEENGTLNWESGKKFGFKLKLFGIFPFGVHKIDVLRFDLDEGIFTSESNKHVPVWNHEILLEKTDDHKTRYTDIVTIDAGWKTVFVYLWAICFYSHRQRKWMKLLKNTHYLSD